MSLDAEGIARNARHYADVLGLEGIFCNGLVGEGWSLTTEERKQALEASIAGGGKKLRVGVVATHHSLRETLELTRHAAQAGADHAVLLPPSGLFGQEELYAYVCEVAAGADIPLVLFDTPLRGGFSPAVIRRLAGERRVVAVKSTRDADSIDRLREECGDLLTICDPYETHALANLARFDARCLYADPEPYLFQTATSHPIRDYFAAYARGDAAAAVATYRRLEPLRRTYERWILRPLRDGLPPNAAIKRWCAEMRLAVGPVRSPLRPLAPEEERVLVAELQQAFAQVDQSG